MQINSAVIGCLHHPSFKKQDELIQIVILEKHPVLSKVWIPFKGCHDAFALPQPGKAQTAFRTSTGIGRLDCSRLNEPPYDEWKTGCVCIVVSTYGLHICPNTSTMHILHQTLSKSEEMVVPHDKAIHYSNEKLSLSLKEISVVENCQLEKLIVHKKNHFQANKIW